MNPTVIASLVATAGSIIVAIITVAITMRRYPSRRVQDGSTLVEAAENIVRLLREDVDNLRARVNALEGELSAEEERTDILEQELATVKRTLNVYRRGVALLIAQIEDLGHPPAWRPEEGLGPL